MQIWGRSAFKKWRGLRTQAWLERRIPASSRLGLNRKNLFILPTSFGWGFLCALVVMLMMGSNYQNNLILALGLWLLAMWLLCLVLCHQNLSGSVVSVVQRPEGQCDHPLRLLFAIEKANKTFPNALTAEFKTWPYEQASQHQNNQLSVDIEVVQRGRKALPRVSIASVFPLGIFRCWTVADFNSELIAYPAPLSGYACPAQELSEEHDIEQTSSDSQLQSEFAGLKTYRSGERKSLLAWKQYAAGRGLQTKVFSGNPALDLHLTDRLHSGLDYEQGLSVLAFWVRQLAQQQQSFSLQVGGQQLASGSGLAHQRAALQLLAEAPKQT
ncbi:DUF58 domain-containing protein [Agarivorans sp. 1_MG-2023]|uniref:DUF58 domain-containing protein n=1 Tax=Agarivorans sp. 1_MG-2023 TaxID=3062634 RepID=UPI0026E1FFEF|nr:DUF58 domain-containing protein [Agarivorans sp. 1_MG-2023]MDO6762477.1 hypothetical protein [Agarivorans sp. 1_MG-2023]